VKQLRQKCRTCGRDEPSTAIVGIGPSTHVTVSNFTTDCPCGGAADVYVTDLKTAPTRRWWLTALLSFLGVLLFAFVLWCATPSRSCASGAVSVVDAHGEPRCVEVRP
jgi:hypothetical protein